MKTIVVVLADTHINSKFGLCDQEVRLDEGGFYLPNLLQQWLYQNYMAFVTKLAALKNTGYKIVLVLNGDIVDMNKKNPYELVNLTPAYVKRHALDLLKPAWAQADVVLVTKGTPTHVGDVANLEEELAEQLGAQYDEHTNAYARWKLKLLVDDVLFNIAHHGTDGRQAWTATNPMLVAGTNIIIEHLRGGERIPSVVVRHHKHVYLDTHNTLPVRVIQGPGWMFPNDYVHKMRIERQATFGGLIFEVEGDKYTLREDTFYELAPDIYNPTVIIE